MKLLIEIDEDVRVAITRMGLLRISDEMQKKVDRAIQNGIPIPNNATNGDMIKAMFPNAEIHFDGNDVFFHHMGFWIKCNIRWWNAPYQKGGKK